MSITLLRHASSTFNEGNQTEKDCGLSETGKLQAESISGHYDIVIVSVMRRARETLEYSNITYDRLIESALFREKMDSICDYLEDESEGYKESHNTAIFRANTARGYLKIIQSENPEANILVVSHAFFMTYLLRESRMIYNVEHIQLDLN